MSPGELYAVTKGSYFGSNLVYIKKTEDIYEFLNLPDMENVSIPEKDVDLAQQNQILELLEMLPDDIIDICIKQYEKNINTRQ